MPIELKDLSFTILIIIMAAFAYYLSSDLVFSFFCLIFFGISYMEAEIGRLAVSINKDDLKLRKEQVPRFREYYGVVKWWAPFTVTLTFGLTSFVFTLKDMPWIHTWVLLALFMYAVSMMTIGFAIFLLGLIREGTVAKHVYLNSLFLLLFSIVTALISGTIASFFRIPFFEDIVAAIFPLLVYDIFRLNFVRNAIFSVRVSSIEQAVKMLSFTEKQYVDGDPFLRKLSMMKKKMNDFLLKTIVLERQESEILSAFNSIEQQCPRRKNSRAGQNIDAITNILKSLKRERENLELRGPFYLQDEAFYVGYYYDDVEALRGFSVYECKSESTVLDAEIARRVAISATLLNKTKKPEMGIRGRLHSYYVRLSLMLIDVFHRIFRWQIKRNISNWISKFDEFERAKYEGSIGLDITGSLDHIIARSLLYADLILSYLNGAFLEGHSSEAAMMIIEYKERKLDLYEEQMRIWEKRIEAANIVPLKVLGTGTLRKSSEKIKKEIAIKNQQLRKWLVSLDQETQNLLEILRAIN